ncbi:MAG: UvrD-helicase domain-containing protein [Clostridia bacterium]|nr:UvrD-helicase domain-containing protein [Clostridia bacterium]
MGQEVEYTPEQRSVIEFTENNLLVSAAAGSGKTTVMIQRVCELMTREKEPVPISKFLIISFTKASASDMKNKLIKKLSSLEPTPYILEQIDDIMTSDVSNLHSFCARLLKSYFYEVGLDPTFVVLDEQEVEAFKEKALNKLFADKTEAGDKDFYELVDIFSKSRKDTGLREAILKLYNFLCSIVDRDGWYKKSIKGLFDEDLSKNVGAKIINGHMKAEKLRCEKLIQEKIDVCAKAGLKDLVGYLQSVDSVFKLIRMDSGFLENAKRLNDKPRMPNIPKATEGKEFMQEEVKALKTELIKRFDDLKKYACADEIEDIIPNLKKTKERLEALYNLTLEFEKNFKTLKREKGGLDFNDLEQYSLLVLKNPTILEEIKKKYEYVLVDEYQDINDVQETILTLLSRENNRFMVGDVKQSIYRFRLCDPEIFLEKYNLYGEDESKGKLILLNANFRSKSGILDFVNAIFNVVMTEDFGGVDYEGEAKLVAGKESQIDNEQRVELLFADTTKLSQKQEQEISVYSVKEDKENAVSLEKQGQAEGLMIAEKIADLMAHYKIKDADTGKMRKIKFADITILTQSRTAFLNKLTDVLREKGIPVSTDIEGDSLEDEYVYGVKTFLETVACYKSDYSLFSCMYSKTFDFTADELAQIKIAGAGEDFFYKNVEFAVNSGKLGAELQEKLENFFKTLAEFRNQASFLTVKEIAKEIVEKQKVRIKMGFEPDAESRTQKLNRFIGSLGDQNVYEYLSDKGLSSVKCEPVYAGGAVKVMTIHKSKGLEFGVVFLVGVTRKFNFQSMRTDLLISKDHGFAIDYYDRVQRYKSPTIAKQAVKLKETRKMLEEEERLLYVALTRATDYLYIVGSGDFEAIKTTMPTSPVCFMDFMGALFVEPDKYPKLTYTVKVADAMDLIDADEKPQLKQVLISDYDDKGVSQINEVLDFKYSFEESTKLPVKTTVSYLADEETEKQVFVYIDEEDKSSAENGTLQHKIMQHLSLTESTEEEIVEKVAELETLGAITKEQANNVMVEGIYKLLTNEEFKKLIAGAKQVLKEREFYTLIPLAKDINNNDNVIVQGIVDLCLVYDDGLVIIDYKTGNLGKHNLDRYKTQVEIYSSAMERAFKLPVNKMCLASIKSGELVNF